MGQNLIYGNCDLSAPFLDISYFEPGCNLAEVEL